MSKPPLGRVAVGDRLLVIPNSHERGKAEVVPVTVTSIGRVWIDLAEVTDGRPRTWRLRLDTQDDGKTGAYHDRFVTPEQYTRQERQSAAYAYLREQRVLPSEGSPWRTEERMLTLANLLRHHDGLPAL